jgi:hypothetical protein
VIDLYRQLRCGLTLPFFKVKMCSRFIFGYLGHFAGPRDLDVIYSRYRYIIGND